MKTGIVRLASWSLATSERRLTSCIVGGIGDGRGGGGSGGGDEVSEYRRQLRRTLNTSARLWMPSSRSYHSGDGGGGGDGDGGIGKGSGNIKSRPPQLRRPSGLRIRLGRHVREALANGEPIVALESTVITHGLPEPENLELALSLERKIARCSCFTESSSSSFSSAATFSTSSSSSPASNGDDDSVTRTSGTGAQQRNGQQPDKNELAVDTTTGAASSSQLQEEQQQQQQRRTVTPATVGIVKGQLIVGLSIEEIEYLAQRERSKPIKASRRDVPITMALGLSAGTTVSATMAIASSLRWQRDVSSKELDCCYEAAPDANINQQWSSSSSSSSPPPLIKVFATGGTGGVHLGGESSLDISADLYEFARSPMGVVASGFKSFLDTRRSLEYLETLGCTVASLSAASRGHLDTTCDLFPGFFTTTNHQGVKSPCVLHDIEQAARLLFHCLELPLSSRRAMLLAVPIPRKFSLDQVLHDEALQTLGRCVDERDDLPGKDKTPLILERLNELTGGRSVQANMELLRNNAQVGAQLAFEYALLSQRTGAILGHDFASTALEAAAHASNDLESSTQKLKDRGTAGSEAQRQRFGKAAAVDFGKVVARSAMTNTTTSTPTSTVDELGELVERSGVADRPSPRHVVVVGCTMIDMHVSTKIDDHFKTNSGLFSGITFKGQPHLTLGGVGRNLATALEFLDHEPVFITSLANDNLASFALPELKKAGFGGRLRIVSKPDLESSCFALVLIDSIGGQCEYVIANLNAVDAIDRAAICQNVEHIERAPLVVIDANLSDDTIEQLIKTCHELTVPIFIEPTDKVALPRLVNCFKRLNQLDQNSLNSLLCLSPNVLELKEILRLFEDENESRMYDITGDCTWSLKEIETAAHRLMEVHLPQLKCLLVTMDKQGVLVAVKSKQEVEDVILIEKHGDQSEIQPIRVRSFKPPHLVEKPVSASGAGDSFAAGFISGILEGCSIRKCLSKGFEASKFALYDQDTISSRLRDISKFIK